MSKSTSLVEFLDEAAEKTGLTREEIVSTLVKNLYLSYKIFRAVRNKDTARVVAYGIAAIRADLAYYHRVSRNRNVSFSS